MPCLVALIALFAPRLVMVVMVIVSDYIGNAYETTIVPLLGFFFLPYTTLAYAWAWHAGDGSISGLPLVVVILGVLLDLGVIGGSAKSGDSGKVCRRE